MKKLSLILLASMTVTINLDAAQAYRHSDSLASEIRRAETGVTTLSVNDFEQRLKGFDSVPFRPDEIVVGALAAAGGASLGSLAAETGPWTSYFVKIPLIFLGAYGGLTAAVLTTEKGRLARARREFDHPRHTDILAKIDAACAVLPEYHYLNVLAKVVDKDVPRD